MSNGNLDNSAPFVGVLKLQITWPKQRGLEPERTSPKWVITAISRSTTHPRKLITEKRATHTAGPLGSTWPLPSSTWYGLNYQNVCTFLDRWHMPWSKPSEERKEHGRQGNGSSQKAWWQSCANERAWVTRSDIPRISSPRRGLKWWNYSLDGWREYRLGTLIFPVCQTQVNHQQDHRYLHPPLATTFPMLLSFMLGPRWLCCCVPVSYYRWEVQHQVHVIFFLPDAQAVGLHGGSSNIWEPQRLDNWKLA